MKAFVYYNIHKQCWSIKALSGTKKGLVIAHADAVTLANAKGKVSEAGRQRVLRDKRKNVHAGVVGELMYYYRTDSKEVVGQDSLFEITYNPYKYSSFVYKSDESPFDGCKIAYMKHRRVFVTSQPMAS